MTIKDLLNDAYRDGMTLEEIETALAGITLPNDGSDEIARLKKALDNSNSEAASYKKQLREKMSEDEVKAREEAERVEELQKKYDELLRESTISKHKARLLALGYEDALATETAEALARGDMDKVFANQQRHIVAVEKKVRADILRDTPKPTGGNGQARSAEDIMKISDAAERQAAIAENMELFEK